MIAIPRIPDRMKHLEKDHRGYPIPWTVFRDNDNNPHFTINDTLKVMRCKSEDLCAICGFKLLRGRWFVGGPGSAIHPLGAYIDPPLHHECMTFALCTCPYLISAKYTKRIDTGTLDPAKTKGVVAFLDPTLDPTRPKLFIAVMAIGQNETPNGYLAPKRPYRRMEFWKDGVLLGEFDTKQIAGGMPDIRSYK